MTGWWQTFVSDDDKKIGYFNPIMAKFSRVHTDDYFPQHVGTHHASEHFKILVACMAVALIVTILLGVALACQTMQKSWMTVLAFLLGILVPALVLYFN
jgi:ABC-type proline/glycine betaine transport system permease subunit